MFTDKERLIFVYQMGETKVYGDPLALYRKMLVACGGDIDGVVSAAYATAVKASPVPSVPVATGEGQPAAIPEPEIQPVGECDGSMDRLIDAIRSAFDLPSINPATGAGVPDAAALKLFDIFTEFLNEKKILSAD